LPRRIEKGQLADGRRGPLPAMLDRDLELDLGAGPTVFRAHVSEHQVLLEQWGPGAARGVPNLLPTSIYGMTRAPRDVRDVRRDPALQVQSLERDPVHLQPDETPCSS